MGFSGVAIRAPAARLKRSLATSEPEPKGLIAGPRRLYERSGLNVAARQRPQNEDETAGQLGAQREGSADHAAPLHQTSIHSQTRGSVTLC